MNRSVQPGGRTTPRVKKKTLDQNPKGLLLDWTARKEALILFDLIQRKKFSYAEIRKDILISPECAQWMIVNRIASLNIIMALVDLRKQTLLLLDQMLNIGKAIQ